MRYLSGNCHVLRDKELAFFCGAVYPTPPVRTERVRKPKQLKEMRFAVAEKSA